MGIFGQWLINSCPNGIDDIWSNSPRVDFGKHQLVIRAIKVLNENYIRSTWECARCQLPIGENIAFHRD
jgi:hypothetical protein